MARQPFEQIPLAGERSQRKPRRRGLTMMMDWGLPLGLQREWLGMQARYVDLAKLVVGTARLYEEEYLLAKLALYREHQVSPFLGGQFLEYVFATQGMAGVRPYCEEARRLGVEAVEVSDNVVSLDAAQRRAIIATAVDCGLHVHGEVGSKSEESDAATLIAQAEACFEAGADVVLIEGAELVRPDGAPDGRLIEALRAALDTDRVIFELSGTWIPGTRSADVYQLKVFLVRTFGPDVNLANVLPEQILETEALRVGLSVTGPPRGAGDPG
jgi:phosphosulfolactate synthase